MSLTTGEIGLVATRWHDELVGGILRKAISPVEPDRVVLEVRTRGCNHYLHIVTDRFSSRICRIAQKPRSATRPHPFVMLLRGHGTGAVIGAVRQINDDRVIAIDFHVGTLICELTSRHGNLFWIGRDGLIAGSFYPNRSHKRALVAGQPYVEPLRKENAATRPHRFDDDAQFERRIEDYYRDRESDAALEKKRRVITRMARIARRRLKRLLSNLEEDIARAQEAEVLRNRAFLIQANLGRAQRGDSQLEVTDFEGNDVVVPLDPSLDAVSNMERLFKRSKRLGRATPQILERHEAATGWLVRTDLLVERISVATEDLLDEMREELEKRFPDLAVREAKRKGAAPEHLPYRTVGIVAGKIARIGRNAVDNDVLTLKHAGPNDLWLHVRGRKGSHVVVPMGRGEDPTSDVLVDAAHLAIHFSEARGEDDVEVTYTRRKYVRKPRGVAPGSVSVTREKTLMLRLDEARLKRLLDTDR
jgi:predicted ribosome quality control (RQC) complex YloA/Tae2 family protein